MTTDQQNAAPVENQQQDPPDFAHASERVAAEIFDHYGIEWLYEPRSFPLEWDAKGHVLSWFTPDFYLPEYDFYIELTTMSQKLVTKKNRKVRRLKELYPDVNIKIFYQKDFRRLLQRFGIAAEEQPLREGGGVIARQQPHPEELETEEQ